ncbi:response regulator transcription factor [Nonomuraea terrae]|uniref:response regulator n=1 Tax=Nonomuraea terrae TaxID=2530383 RepID=UPI001CB7495D
MNGRPSTTHDITATSDPAPHDITATSDPGARDFAVNGETRGEPSTGGGVPDLIRVCVVDDQTLVRQGIRSLLDLATGIEVVAEADDGLSALTAISEHPPDVVLLDLRMPRHDGIWTLRALRDSGIDVPVLVLTTFDDDELALQALRAGARGYLLKDVTLDQLVGAVRTLAAGGTLVQPAITDRLLRAIRDGDASPPAPDGETQIQDLTERELEVLRLLAGGYSNREIADALFLAEGTVKNHVSSVLLKLGTRDRTRAVLRALHHGLLS